MLARLAFTVLAALVTSLTAIAQSPLEFGPILVDSHPPTSEERARAKDLGLHPFWTTYDLLARSNGPGGWTLRVESSVYENVERVSTVADVGGGWLRWQVPLVRRESRDSTYVRPWTRLVLCDSQGAELRRVEDWVPATTPFRPSDSSGPVRGTPAIALWRADGAADTPEAFWSQKWAGLLVRLQVCGVDAGQNALAEARSFRKDQGFLAAGLQAYLLPIALPSAKTPDATRAALREDARRFVVGTGPSREERGHFVRCADGALDLFVLDTATFLAPASDGRPAQLLGPAQWEWLSTALLGSKATYKFVYSELPWSPDPQRALDGRGETVPSSWAAFPGERERFVALLGQLKAAGVVLVSANAVHAGVHVHSTTATVGYDVPELLLSASGDLSRPCAAPGITCQHRSKLGKLGLRTDETGSVGNRSSSMFRVELRRASGELDYFVEWTPSFLSRR
ncbi:MAG: alkaline phosphatase D family protein [Planctomycetaceae bacterium]|nr:alkaline phosphatase D family protein [Planctomycetaceae bacterium]